MKFSKAQLDYYIRTLLDYIIINNYKGWDPYDISNSYLLRKFSKKDNTKLIMTQANRLIPINLRKITRTKKEYNTKAMALFLSSYINLSFRKYSNEINKIMNWLISNKSQKYNQYSIGFTFDILLSGYSSKKGEPSLIITLFVMFAFFKYYKKVNEKNILKIILSFNELINNELPQNETKDTLWYSYNFEKINEIYNATAKIGKFYSFLYSIIKDDKVLEKIDKILNYLFRKQRPDGSWSYGETVNYTDGFHTAFVLEAIYEMLKFVEHKKYKEMYSKGVDHYMYNLIKKNGQPLYFHPIYSPKDVRKYLIKTDIRDCAMAIIFCKIIQKRDIADSVLNWTLNNMYNPQMGYFYYFKNKFWTNKIEFIRWQAWMLYAFSILYT